MALVCLQPKQERSWPSIIPNAQVVIIPHPTNYPSRSVHAPLSVAGFFLCISLFSGHSTPIFQVLVYFYRWTAYVTIQNQFLKEKRKDYCLSDYWTPLPLGQPYSVCEGWPHVCCILVCMWCYGVPWYFGVQVMLWGSMAFWCSGYAMPLWYSVVFWCSATFCLCGVT